MKSTRVVLAKRPAGEPDDSCFAFEDREVRPLGDGEILMKVLWLSLDPYMRGRMNDMKSYADPLKIGDVMTAESAGRLREAALWFGLAPDRVLDEKIAALPTLANIQHAKAS